MRFLIAILLPPLGLLLCGKVFQAILCVLLCVTVLGYLPAAVWALCVVNSHYADRRMDRLVRAMRPRMAA